MKLKRMICRKGEGMWELWKIIVAVVVLAILGFGIYLTITKKGFGDEGILAGIKNWLKFGGNA
jgi:hypothetical protein